MQHATDSISNPVLHGSQGSEDSAHSDEPLKEGNVHISAPHIYGSALEALELQPNSSLSFLNVGSGTGYLSCIVAEILGQKSLNFGKLFLRRNGFLSLVI